MYGQTAHVTITVDLHLLVVGLVGLLSLACLLIHRALQRGSALAWLATATLCVGAETLLLHYAGPSPLAIAAIALLVPAAYFCASQAVRAVSRLPRVPRRVVIGAGGLTALSLILLALPVSPTLRYIPFQLAGFLVFFDTMLALARAPHRGVLDTGLLVLGLLVNAALLVRLPMFPELLGQPAPWAAMSADLLDLVPMPVMGILTASLVVLVVARIVATVITDYRLCAERDALTDLLNRRAFDALADAPASSHGAVIMCDIDHFKTVNDRYGHHAGDEVIRSFARMLSLREGHVARVGGEEFALLLPDTTVQEAALEADRIRVAFSQSVHPTLDGSVRLSASFGVAGFERGTPVREALRQADLALYAAKRSGRNLVRIAQDEAALSAPLANAA